jgi:phosphate:Na+ symporter
VEGARQVAMFHTLYNVATLLLLIPFVTLLAKLMQTIIPVKSDEANEIHERKLIYLDVKAAQVPTLAVVNAKLEICRMGKIANENLELALESFFEKSENKANKVLENEKTVDFLNQNITSKLVEISNLSLSAGDAERVGEMFGILSDIERIGDHAENIAEYALTIQEENLKFSEIAIAELKALSDATTKITTKALEVYESQNKSQLPKIELLEKKVDQLASEFTENHIQRLKTEGCEPKNGVIFIDMINDLERSADHAENIAFSILSTRRRRVKKA